MLGEASFNVASYANKINEIVVCDLDKGQLARSKMTLEISVVKKEQAGDIGVDPKTLLDKRYAHLLNFPNA